MTAAPRPATHPCRLCARPLVERYRRNGYRIGACGACGALSVMEAVGPEELAAHYEREALPEYREQFTTLSRTARRVAEGRLDRIEARRPTGRGRLLDVGCGFGSFLEIAQARGWETWGVELIEEGRRRSRTRLGHARVHAALADLAGDVRFDVACLWDVLEHVPEPVDFLRELHDRLASRGIVALSTVNAACWNLKILGERWPYFTPPRHLVYFTHASLTAALERSGFRVLHVQTRFMWHALWQPLGFTGGGVAGRIVRSASGRALAVAANRAGAGDMIDVVAVRT